MDGKKGKLKAHRSCIVIMRQHDRGKTSVTIRLPESIIVVVVVVEREEQSTNSQAAATYFFHSVASYDRQNVIKLRTI